MKIELLEDNGFLNDGKPTLVVLQITDNLGKVFRVPYQADKTIQELYQDLMKLPAEVTRNYIKPFVDQPAQLDYGPGPSVEKLPEFTLNKIECEDIVECVLVHPRDPNIEESAIPVVGKKYRVFDIRNIPQVGRVYELLDDESSFKKLIMAYSNEVKLLAKRPPLKPGEERVMKLQTTHKCSCGEINALQINDDQTKYVGDCACGKHHEVERPVTAKKEA